MKSLGFNYEITIGKRFWLWFAVFLLFLLSATLDIYTTNPGSRFMLTKNFARYFRFWIDPADRNRYSYLDYAIHDGKIYSDKPPVLALLAVPFYWLGMLLAYLLYGFDATVLEQDEMAKIVIVFAILIVNSIGILRCYDLLENLGYSEKTRFITTISIGFGSLFYSYAHTFFSHALVASFLIMTLYHLTNIETPAKSHKKRDALLAGMFLGFAMGSDYVILFVVPLFYLFLLLNEHAFTSFAEVKKHIVHTILFTVPMFIIGLFVLFYNFVCFGNPFHTAYRYLPQYFLEYQHFLNPVTNGIYVVLFSNAHGMLLFTPLLFFAILGVPFTFKDNPKLASLLLSIFFLIVFFYGKSYKPDAGLNYGDRFILAAATIFLLSMAALIERILREKNLFGGLVYVIFAIPSFFFSFAGAWISIFPSGGEAMQNPLFGDDTGVGHVQNFYFFLTTITNVSVWIHMLQGNPFPAFTSSSILRSSRLLFLFLSGLVIYSFFKYCKVEFLNVSHGRIHNEARPPPFSRKMGIFSTSTMGGYLILFCLMYIFYLAKELSTATNIDNLAKIYPDDIFYTIFIGLLYVIGLLYSLFYKESPKQQKPTSYILQQPYTFFILGVTMIFFRLTVSFTPIHSYLNDVNLEVLAFIGIMSVFGLFFSLWGIILQEKESLIFVFNYLISRTNTQTLQLNQRFRKTSRYVSHYQIALPFLISATLIYIVFGVEFFLSYFLLFWVHTFSLYSITGFLWRIAMLYEIIGFSYMIFMAYKSQHS